MCVPGETSISCDPAGHQRHTEKERVSAVCDLGGSVPMLIDRVGLE